MFRLSEALSTLDSRKEIIPSPSAVESGEISWLEPDRKGRFPVDEITYSVENVDFVKKLLVETDAKIRGREFNVGCGEKDCAWCRMHRENALPEVFLDEEEGLDD